VPTPPQLKGEDVLTANIPFWRPEANLYIDFTQPVDRRFGLHAGDGLLPVEEQRRIARARRGQHRPDDPETVLAGRPDDDLPVA
jgi:hypothetical protein